MFPSPKGQQLWQQYNTGQIKFNDMDPESRKEFLQTGVDTGLLDTSKLKPEVIQQYGVQVQRMPLPTPSQPSQQPAFGQGVVDRMPSAVQPFAQKAVDTVAPLMQKQPVQQQTYTPPAQPRTITGGPQLNQQVAPEFGKQQTTTNYLAQALGSLIKPRETDMPQPQFNTPEMQGRISMTVQPQQPVQASREPYVRPVDRAVSLNDQIKQQREDQERMRKESEQIRNKSPLRELIQQKDAEKIEKGYGINGVWAISNPQQAIRLYESQQSGESFSKPKTVGDISPISIQESRKRASDSFSENAIPGSTKINDDGWAEMSPVERELESIKIRRNHSFNDLVDAGEAELISKGWNFNGEWAVNNPLLSKAIGSTLSVTDKVFDSPWMARAGQKGADLATFNQRDAEMQHKTGSAIGDLTADVAGSIGGFLTPIQGLGATPTTRGQAAQQIVQPATSKIKTAAQRKIVDAFQNAVSSRFSDKVIQSVPYDVLIRNLNMPAAKKAALSAAYKGIERTVDGYATLATLSLMGDIFSDNNKNPSEIISDANKQGLFGAVMYNVAGMFKDVGKDMLSKYKMKLSNNVKISPVDEKSLSIEGFKRVEPGVWAREVNGKIEEMSIEYVFVPGKLFRPVHELSAKELKEIVQSGRPSTISTDRIAISFSNIESSSQKLVEMGYRKIPGRNDTFVHDAKGDIIVLSSKGSTGHMLPADDVQTKTIEIEKYLQRMGYTTKSMNSAVQLGTPSRKGFNYLSDRWTSKMAEKGYEAIRPGVYALKGSDGNIEDVAFRYVAAGKNPFPTFKIDTIVGNPKVADMFKGLFGDNYYWSKVVVTGSNQPAYHQSGVMESVSQNHPELVNTFYRAAAKAQLLDAKTIDSIASSESVKSASRVILENSNQGASSDAVAAIANALSKINNAVLSATADVNDQELELAQSFYREVFEGTLSTKTIKETPTPILKQFVEDERITKSESETEYDSMVDQMILEEMELRGSTETQNQPEQPQPTQEVAEPEKSSETARETQISQDSGPKVTLKSYGEVEVVGREDGAVKVRTSDGQTVNFKSEAIFKAMHADPAAYREPGDVKLNTENEVEPSAETPPATPVNVPEQTETAVSQATLPALSELGLESTFTTTKNGKPVYEISGSTKENKDALKAAGGRYFKPKNVWSFYGEEDPAPRIIEARNQLLGEAQSETEPVATEQPQPVAVQSETPQPVQDETPTTVEPDTVTAVVPKESKGSKGVAKTNDGNDVSFSYAVVDANQLVASHDTGMNPNDSYPKELQPRQRERAASVMQVNEIMNNLQPDFLGENPKVSDGAPIIGSDMVVESGNGRTIALKKLYETGHLNTQKYLDWLNANRDKFGIKGELPQNPVLVRVRETEVDRPTFAKQANESSVATMSATEQARSDAEKLDGSMMELLSPSEDGSLNNADNKSFVESFVGKVIPSTETGKYVTTEGKLSQDGLNRVRNAVFFKAYGDLDMMDKMAESLDNNIKTITNSMIGVAPRMVEVKEQIGKGELYQLDFSGDVAAAANKYVTLKENGMAVEEFLAQQSMVPDLDDVQREILDVMDKNNRSAKKLTGLLNTVLDVVVAAGNPNQLSLLENVVPTKADTLVAAARRFNNEQTGNVEGQVQLEVRQGESADSGQIDEAGKPETKRAAAGAEEVKKPAAQKTPEPKKETVKESSKPKAAETKPTDKIDDFGEKIGGARKDMWASKRMVISDLKNMTDREAADLVTKDAVFGEINYEELVDSGVPVEVAWVIKSIKDALPKKPPVTKNEEDNREYRKAYIELVSAVRDELAEITSAKDFEGFFARAVSKNDMFKVYNAPWNRIEPRDKYVSGVFGKGRGLASKMQPRRYDFSRAIATTDKSGWPRKVEVWRRNIEIRYASEGDTVKSEKVKAPGMYYILNHKPYDILAKGFTTKDEAEKYLNETLKPVLQEQSGKKKSPDYLPPQLQHIQRTGPDHRNGKDATPDDFLATFGFRGGEFGNWVNQNERQQSLNFAYDALMDMANILNIPPQAVSLNGELGIAFGARGRTKAHAHYEPAKMVINLTKMKGAGKLFHEWMHALDDYLGKQGGVAESQRGYLSEVRLDKMNLRPEVVTAFKELVSKMQTRILSKEDTVKEMISSANKKIGIKMKDLDRYTDSVIRTLKASDKRDYSRARKATEAEIKKAEQLAGEIKKAQAPTSTKTKSGRGMGIEMKNKPLEELNKIHKAVTGRQINKDLHDSIAWALFSIQSDQDRIAKAESGDVKNYERNSLYLENAKAIDKESGKSKLYWSTPVEMLARAGEAYMEDVIGQQGNKSQYLVYGTDNDIYRMLNKENLPYPDGEERKTINAAFKTFFDTLKTKPSNRDGKETVMIYEDGANYAPVQGIDGPVKPSQITDFRVLSRSGIKTRDDYVAQVVPSKISEHAKMMIALDMEEATRRGAGKPNREVSYDEWHYRSYGNKTPEGVRDYEKQFFYRHSELVENGMSGQAAAKEIERLELKKFERFQNRTDRTPLGKVATRYGQEERKRIEQALSDLEKTETAALRRAGGKDSYADRQQDGTVLHALGFRRDLIRQGWVDLTGKEVTGPEQLAVVAQTFRDPRFETFRYIYTRGGKIVGHEGTTSRLPSSSAIKTDAKTMEGIRNRMRRLRADGFYLLHNHPSGVPEPSAEDKQATVDIAMQLPGFKAHVVINSGAYSVITVDGDKMKAAQAALKEWTGNSSAAESSPWTNTNYPMADAVTKKLFDAGKKDALLSPEIDSALLGMEVTSPDRVAQSYKLLSVKPDNITLIMADAKMRIRAVQEIPAGIFSTHKAAQDYLRGRAREFGAGNMYAVLPSAEVIGEEQLNKLMNVSKRLVGSNSLVDALEAGGLASSSLQRKSELGGKFSPEHIETLETGGRFGMPIKSVAVRESESKYTVFNEVQLTKGNLQIGSYARTKDKDKYKIGLIMAELDQDTALMEFSEGGEKWIEPVAIDSLDLLVPETVDEAQAAARVLKTIGMTEQQAIATLMAQEMPFNDWVNHVERLDLPELEGVKYDQQKGNWNELKKVHQELKDRIPQGFMEQYKDLMTDLYSKPGLDKDERKAVKGMLDRLEKSLKKSKVEKMLPLYRDTLKELMAEFDFGAVYRTTGKIRRLDKIRTYLDENPDMTIPELEAMQNNMGVSKTLVEEVNKLDQKRLVDMDYDEAIGLIQLVSNIIRTAKMHQKIMFNGKEREIKEVVDSITNNIEKEYSLVKDGKIIDSSDMSKRRSSTERFLKDQSFLPVFIMERVEGVQDGELKKFLYDAIRDGFSNKYRYYYEAMDGLREAIGDTDVEKWDKHFQKKKKNLERITFKLKKGVELTITPAERMEIYLHTLNKQNYVSLTTGVRLESDEYQKVVFEPDDIDMIVKSMTADEKRIADWMFKFLNSRAKEFGNAASVNVKGYEIFNVPNYWPMKKRAYDAKTTEDPVLSFINDLSLQNAGPTKSRQNSKNPLLIRGAFAAFYDSVDFMSSYGALAEPLTSAKKIMHQINEPMGKKNLSDVRVELQHYLKDVEGMSRNDTSTLEQMGAKALSNIQRSILGLNLGVIFKQPISYIVAAVEMDIKYLAQAFPKASKSKHTWKEINEKSPQLRTRSEGKINREVSEIGSIGAVRQFVFGTRGYTDMFTAGIQKADSITIGAIWEAVKLETKDLHPELEGDAFWDHVDKRTIDIVNRTQPTSLVYTRSKIGRSQSIAVRMATTFSTQRNKNYNIIARMKWKYDHSEKTWKDKAEFIRGLIVFFGSLVALGATDASRNRFLKRNRRTDFFDPVSIAENLLGNIYGVGYVTGSIRSKIEMGSFSGFDASDPLNQNVNKAIDAVSNVYAAVDQFVQDQEGRSIDPNYETKWEQKALKAFDESLTAFLPFAGIPYYNIKTYLPAMVKQLLDPSFGPSSDAVSVFKDNMKPLRKRYNLLEDKRKGGANLTRDELKYRETVRTLERINDTVNRNLRMIEKAETSGDSETAIAKRVDGYKDIIAKELLRAEELFESLN